MAAAMNAPQAPRAAATRRLATPPEFWPLAALFAALYYLQGVSEPTEGLIAQPVTRLLETWHHSAGEIATFSALVSLPWALKPVFGLACDFLPLPGGRFRGYLTLSSALAAGCLFVLYLAPVERGDAGRLLSLVTVATFGVAFADVAVDALMVAKGRRYGITGSLQAVQWGAMYAATLFVGFVGGSLTERGRTQEAFLICAACAAFAAVLALVYVREPQPIGDREPFRVAARALMRNLSSPAVWRIAAFLFLWNFNPVSSRILQLYMTGPLGLSQEAYGAALSWFAAGSLAGCAAFPWIARRTTSRTRAHAAIVLGIGGNLAYLGLVGEAESRAISVLAGIAYMLATLALFDLAASVCAPRVAGTMFALFMSVSNASTALATWAGGAFQDNFQASWDDGPTYRALVVAGAACTAGCWFVFPADCGADA